MPTAVVTMSKVVILLCGPSLKAVGGGPTHMRNMLSSPLKDRYELIHFEIGSRGAESPSNEETMTAMVARIIVSPFTLIWKIIRHRPSVVHLNCSLNHKALWRDLMYVFIGRFFGRKIVFQIHGGSLKSLCTSGWLRNVARAIFAMPDAIVVLGTPQKTEFEQLGTTRRLVVIPNGVDVNEYRGAMQRVHSGRAERLVFLGRVVKDKGIFEAIDAMVALRSHGAFKSIRFEIAGSGPAEQEVRERIRNQQLQDCVTLVGPLFGKEKVNFLRQADLFLLPSYHEGLPYSILESLAAGTPVIASNVGGIPDVVVDGVNGILIKPGDSSEIVRAVKVLSESTELLRAISRNCLELSSRDLGLERMAEKFFGLYEELLTCS